MSLFIRNGKRFNIHSSATFDGVTYPNFKSPELQAKFNITEIAAPVPPDDYSEDLYYVTEIDEAPYVVYTRVSSKESVRKHNAKIRSQIKAIEQEELLCRPVREFLLDQIDKKDTAWYAKVKNIDKAIKDLRDSLIPEGS